MCFSFQFGFSLEPLLSFSRENIVRLNNFQHLQIVKEEREEQCIKKSKRYNKQSWNVKR